MRKELHSRVPGPLERRPSAESDAPAERSGAVAREDCLNYMADMLDELRVMAGASGLGRLGMMIELAEEEARRLLRQP